MGKVDRWNLMLCWHRGLSTRYSVARKRYPSQSTFNPHSIRTLSHLNCWHNDSMNTSVLKTTLVLSQPPRSMPLTLPALSMGLSKTWVIFFFNYDKKGQDTTKCPSQRRTATPQNTSESLGNLRVNDWDWRGYLVTTSLHAIPGSIPESAISVSRARAVIIAKTITTTRTITMAITSFSLQNKLEKIFLHLRQCRYTVCREGTPLAGLIQLHKPCRQPSGWNFSMQKNLRGRLYLTTIKPLWLGFGGQECLLSRFPPTIRITPMSFFLTGATQAHRYQQ